MMFDLITAVLAVMVATAVLGNVFAFGLKQYEEAFVCYIWAFVTSLLITLVDVTISVNGSAVTTGQLVVDIWFMSVMGAMVVYSSDYMYAKKTNVTKRGNAELLCADDTEGTFIMRFYGAGDIGKAVEYVNGDSPVDGDTHDVIVVGDVMAVRTDSVGRSHGLATELLERFS